jgi:hypothetical protein
MAITDYSIEMTPSIAGQLADLGIADALSFVNSEASAEIPFGYAVVQGSGAKDALLPATSDDICVGIVVHSHAYDPDNDLGTTGVKADRELSILNKGRVWVVVGGTVSVGDRGYVSYDVGAATPGRIMGEDHTDETLDTGAQIKFLTAATSAGDLALVEVDMMNEQGASSVTPSA